MRDISQGLAAWHAAGVRSALATVVQTWSSAPRQPGASMAVSEHGEAIGSVSGGCVEGAVYALAQEVIETGVPVLQTYGVSDEDAFAVGLTCGGILNVFVQPVSDAHFPELPVALDAIENRHSVAVASVISGESGLQGELVVDTTEVHGAIGDPELQAEIVRTAREMLSRDETGVVRVPAEGTEDGEVSVFVESLAAPPLMIVFGAIDFAGAVVRIGKFLGYHVVICDARAIFATEKRFPEADEVVVRWPHQYLAEVETDERTVICVLTHDVKFDVPVLKHALARPAAYIGAMGSRRTHHDRLERLREVGVTEEQLARLSSPIGLDLGARTPEETAVAVAAEFIMLKRGGSSQRLVDGELAIHR